MSRDCTIWAWPCLGTGGSDRPANVEYKTILEMPGDLPPRALLVMDAGLNQYELLRDIGRSGRHFLVRVGANVHLLKGLGAQVDKKAGRLSLAQVLRTVRAASQGYLSGKLWPQLGRATKDRYVRRGPKRSRRWPSRRNTSLPASLIFARRPLPNDKRPKLFARGSPPDRSRRSMAPHGVYGTLTC